MSVTCATCHFAVTPEKSETDGFCYRYPPTAIMVRSLMIDEKPRPEIHAGYPPVALKRFWCGEHKPAAKKPAAIPRRTKRN